MKKRHHMRYGALFRVELRVGEGANFQNYEKTSYVGIRRPMRIFIYQFVIFKALKWQPIPTCDSSIYSIF